ncbi:hypothetical protein [Herbaspirillum sp.]|uniref:hypothetical protein n=1 Tax=Herbaspirillum sp. TaxID=1890675 RepID=UPI0031D203B5
MATILFSMSMRKQSDTSHPILFFHFDGGIAIKPLAQFVPSRQTSILYMTGWMHCIGVALPEFRRKTGTQPKAVVVA